VRPESSRFLDKAREHLERAAIMLKVGLADDAGRAAYLAGFHAAQAFIFENTGKVIKSHNGVQAEFLRLTKEDQRFVPDRRAFLSRAYNLKAVADYETAAQSAISHDRADQAIAEGTQFVSHIAELLSAK
jgi:uncharacterized protein (UPF0332 family)